MNNILFTPQPVCDLIQEMLPSAELSSEVGVNGFSLHCRVNSQNIFILTRAIDAQAFRESLRDFKGYLNLSKHTNLPITSIDTSRFSLVSKFRDWKRYQRGILNIQEDLAVDFLIDFLERNQGLDRLTQIGISPEQLDNHDEDDLKIFRKFIEKLNQMREDGIERADVIFERFEQQYPGVYQVIWQEIFNQSIQQGNQNDLYGQVLEVLGQRVVGQSHATKLVANTLAAQMNGADRNQFFVFAGAPGVGKSELGKAVASFKENRFIMISMDTYSQEHSCSRLFGAPPGFVGSTSRPHFIQKVSGFNPILICKDEQQSKFTYEIANAVLLFDEIEKAHDKVKQSLLTLFQEGYCEVQYSPQQKSPHLSPPPNTTEVYRFKNSVFIATSNLYWREILDCFDQNVQMDVIVDRFKQWNEQIPSSRNFSAEFLSRATIVPFGPIPRGSGGYQQVIKMKLQRQPEALKIELPCKDVQIEDLEGVLRILEGELYGEGIDLRGIDRYFQNKLQPTIRNMARRANLRNLREITITITTFENNDIQVKATKTVFGKTMNLSGDRVFLVH